MRPCDRTACAANTADGAGDRASLIGRGIVVLAAVHVRERVVAALAKEAAVQDVQRIRAEVVVGQVVFRFHHNRCILVNHTEVVLRMQR